MGRSELLTNESLGRRIRIARETHHYTQRKLAMLLGLDPTTLTKMEAGRREVSAIELARIAHILNLTADELLTAEMDVLMTRRLGLASEKVSGGDDLR